MTNELPVKIEKKPKYGEWLNITEIEPYQEQEIICYDIETSLVFSGYRDRNIDFPNWAWIATGLTRWKFTHWMPAPPPPKC